MSLFCLVYFSVLHNIKINIEKGVFFFFLMVYKTQLISLVKSTLYTSQTAYSIFLCLVCMVFNTSLNDRCLQDFSISYKWLSILTFVKQSQNCTYCISFHYGKGMCFEKSLLKDHASAMPLKVIKLKMKFYFWDNASIGVLRLLLYTPLVQLISVAAQK